MNLDSKSTNLLWHAFITCIWFFLSFLLYIIYKLVIRPLYRMNFYRKQGVSCTYFPVLGRYSTCISDVKNHKDAQYYFKLKSKLAPERLLCTNLGVDASIALHDPALIKEFCLINSENYVKDTVFIELYSIILGKGLLTSEGDQWKVQRKILSSAFHFEFLKSNLPVTQSTAHEILYHLRDTSLKDVNILDVFQTITGEVIGKIFFGEQLNLYQLDGKPLTLGLADMISQIGVLNLSVERHLLGTGFIKKGILPKHKTLMTKADNFRKICRRIVEERKALHLNVRSDVSKKDMLDILLEYSGEEGKVSEEEIVDQFITFFLAGMDTTGHLVTMAVYYLHKYPEMKEKMVQEVEQYYKSNISMDDLNKLEYTMAFLKETLRTMTPVPGLLLRRAIKDHKLKDIDIKKGDIVNIDYWYNHFNAKYFEKPEEFDPTRWLDKDKTVESYAFIPFSGGPRNCIGQHLALIEARIILSELLTMYEFEIKKDYDLKMDFKFLYGPVDPIIMDLTMKEK